jgi:hydrogenase maturation protease
MGPGSPPAAVLGIGNVLLADDAFGPHVVALLAAGFHLPDEVLLLDAGTPGIDLGDYLAGRRHAVLVDSVRAEAPPGTLLVFGKRELLEHRAAPLRQGGHDPALRDTLVTLEMAGQCPAEVVLVGVVPETTRTGAPMSEAVRAAAPGAAREVVRQLAALGHLLTPRLPALPPNFWWELPPTT